MSEVKRAGSTRVMNGLTRLMVAGLTGMIRIYQAVLSPWLGSACRFQPSCSAYAIDALRAHGVIRGVWLAARRLGRCHPLGGEGFDPVPERGVSGP